MLQKILILVLIIFIALVSFRIYKLNHNPASLTINGKEFELEIADTGERQQIGLAKYNSINNNFAMAFPFEKEGYHPFWMKDMKFSIDIIYINKNKVVELFKKVKDPSQTEGRIQTVNPTKKADMVLEINAGLSDKYNIKNGDEVKIKY